MLPILFLFEKCHFSNWLWNNLQFGENRSFYQNLKFAENMTVRGLVVSANTYWASYCVVLIKYIYPDKWKMGMSRWFMARWKCPDVKLCNLVLLGSSGWSSGARARSITHKIATRTRSAQQISRATNRFAEKSHWKRVGWSSNKSHASKSFVRRKGKLFFCITLV